MAIINPSHRLVRGYPRELVEREGKSRMKDYSDTLTVRELVDLVAFLLTNYMCGITPPVLLGPEARGVWDAAAYYGNVDQWDTAPPISGSMVGGGRRPCRRVL